MRLYGLVHLNSYALTVLERKMY